MSMPFAHKQDLIAGWRPLTPAEDAIADSLLADASYWVRVWYPELDPIANDHGPQMVVRSMVKRALLNSDSEGISQATQNETTGPWSHSTTRSFTNPDGSLYLTKREIELLDTITGRGTATATSMTAPGL